MNISRIVFRGILVMAFVALLTASASAGDAILAGSDLWVTDPNGGTFTDFSLDPIPSGFFCPGSRPFTGRIVFQGEAIKTDPPGAFGDADTVVERLDDAVFDKYGTAYTRLQVTALGLRSVAPIETECGSFNVRARLNGEQPVTHMHIIRDGEDGGRFLAPLAMDIKLSFTPAEGSLLRRGSQKSAVESQALELDRLITFAPSPRATWAYRAATKAVVHEASVKADLNGDGITEGILSGTSNFAAGANSSINFRATLIIDHISYAHGHLVRVALEP